MGEEAGRGRPHRPTGHRRRRAARRQALDILYQADVMERPAATVLEDWRSLGKAVSAYAEQLVSGVASEMESIDADLAQHSEEWTVARMAVVDRTILRVACYELRSGLPPAVAINEAVEAANDLSTDDSGRFINGVLGQVARGVQPDPAGEDG